MLMLRQRLTLSREKGRRERRADPKEMPNGPLQLQLSATIANYVRYVILLRQYDVCVFFYLYH